jgi:outer membrane receptor for monomeric catechols
LGVYTEGGQLDGSSLALPLSYFGYTENPGSNYVLATLEGGKRDYQGVEVTFNKLRSDNWNLRASYTYNDAKGNSNSDGNADLQGDFY